MAINNYTWEVGEAIRGTVPIPSFIVVRSQDGAEVIADEGSGVLQSTTGSNGTPFVVTPSDTEFTRLRNGKFTFIFNPDGPADFSRYHFDFFKQGTDPDAGEGHLRFTVSRTRGSVPAYQMRVGVIKRQTPAFSHLPPEELGFLIRTVPLNPASTNGMVFQVEWSVNGAQSTPLSSNPLAPDFPEFSIVFRANTDSSDPDEAVAQLCLTLDTGAVAALDPDAAIGKIADVVGEFGTGLYEYIRALDLSFGFNIPLGAGSGGGGGLGSPAQDILQEFKGGNTFFNQLIQSFFALNFNRDATFTYGADGVSGILEPSETESWIVAENIVGWRLEQLGAISISELIHEETWES